MYRFPRRVKDKLFTAVISGEYGLAVASVGQMGAANPRLLRCDYVMYSGDGHEVDLMKKHVKALRIAGVPCTTTMNLGEYSILSVDAPDVPAAELRAAVRWQIKDLIDFHVDDAVLDVFDAPASGADKRRHNLYVVVSRMNTVKQHIHVLQEAELNLTTIDIPELVIRNLCALCPEDKSGIVFIYLSRNKGVLTVTKDSTLYLARSLEFGYEVLSQSALQSETESSEFNAEFDRVVLEVQRSLDYYDRYFSQPAVAKILLAPTVQSIPGITEYLYRHTGIDASIFDVNDIIEAPEAIDRPRQASCLLAIGAAMRQEKKTL